MKEELQKSINEKFNGLRKDIYDLAKIDEAAARSCMIGISTFFNNKVNKLAVIEDINLNFKMGLLSPEERDTQIAAL